MGPSSWKDELKRKTSVVIWVLVQSLTKVAKRLLGAYEDSNEVLPKEQQSKDWGMDYFPGQKWEHQD